MPHQRAMLGVCSVVLLLAIGFNVVFFAGVSNGKSITDRFAQQPAKQKVQVHSVAVLGDSLVFLSTSDLQAALSPRYPAPHIESVIGVGVAQMRLAIEQMHQSQHPDAVVVALGSNDARYAENALTQGQKQAEITNSVAQQADVLQTLSDTPCVIWVGVQEHNAVLNLTVWGPQLNAGFKANLEDYPNAHWLDWEAQMHGHPEWQDSDGLHFSASGNAAYAAAITAAIESDC